MPQIDLLTSDSKRTLLQLVKRRGDVSLNDAEEATGLARSTLREHFVQLEQDGLVEHYAHRQGRGRPSLRYCLTGAGDRLFPARDGVLLRELLGFLEREGHDRIVETFFETFWGRRLAEARSRMSELEANDRDGRLEVLTRLLREHGFMPETDTEDEAVVVRECNCPFPEAVKKTRLPCQLEAQFLEQVLDAQMNRVSHIPDGHAACTYEFTLEPGCSSDT